MRALLTILLLVSLAPFVAACGFQPLYAERTGAATAELTRVAVLDIPRPDPVGWLVERELTQRLTPPQNAPEPDYELALVLDEERQPLGIQIDASITRYNYALDGTFVLRERATQKPVFSGRSRAVASYNVVTSQFATLAAEQDAIEKAAQQLGADVELQLAVFFAGKTL